MAFEVLQGTVPDRFIAKLRLGPSGCWVWTGTCHGKGYGHFSANKRTNKTHRYVWDAVHGSIPSGMHVLHRCDNPPCCNPAHLFLGTNADNVADRDAKGRQAKGDRNGKQKLTAAQVNEIRAKYEAGGATQKDLAAQYGVDGSWICRLVNYRFRDDI